MEEKKAKEENKALKKADWEQWREKKRQENEARRAQRKQEKKDRKAAAKAAKELRKVNLSFVIFDVSDPGCDDLSGSRYFSNTVKI